MLQCHLRLENCFGHSSSECRCHCLHFLKVYIHLAFYSMLLFIFDDFSSPSLPIGAYIVYGWSQGDSSVIQGLQNLNFLHNTKRFWVPLVGRKDSLRCAKINAQIIYLDQPLPISNWVNFRPKMSEQAI